MLFRFELNGKTYERVPLDSPEFEYDLLIQPYTEDLNVSTTVLDDGEIPMPSFPKLLRMYHQRFVDVWRHDDVTGKFVVVDQVYVSSYVPYNWIPVVFYLENKITWFREYEDEENEEADK